MADDALTDAVARAIEAVDDRAWLNAGPSAKSVPCDYQRYAEAALAVVREHTAAQVAAAKAEALRDAADDLPSATEGPLRVGTALWPECDRDAYSLAVEEAQVALRARAEGLDAEPAPDGDQP